MEYSDGHIQCIECKHLTNWGPEKWTCKAFPKNIPNDIQEGQYDHTQPFKGDKGIRYEKRVEGEE